MEISREIDAMPFRGDLTEEEYRSVLACAKIREYRKGSLVYSPENECLGLIRVLSGSIRAFMLSEEGREVVLYHVKEGGTDLLSASCVINQITFETQMVADADSMLLIIPATCLARLKQNNLALRCYIYEKLGERFSDVMKLMQTMLFTRIDRRIAGVLLGSGSDELRVTHEEIASAINSSREVVSRTLKEMERQSLIMLGRGRIIITDRSGLEAIAPVG